MGSVGAWTGSYDCMIIAGDNVDCWMEIQHGKGPWANPVSGIVPLGTTLTMVIGINDKQGETEKDKVRRELKLKGMTMRLVDRSLDDPVEEIASLNRPLPGSARMNPPSPLSFKSLSGMFHETEAFGSQVSLPD